MKNNVVNVENIIHLISTLAIFVYEHFIRLSFAYAIWNQVTILMAAK